MQVDLKLLQRAEKEARDTGNNPLVVYERLLLSGYSERGRLLWELVDNRENLHGARLGSIIKQAEREVKG